MKESIVVARGYRNIILESEDIAEFEHKPSKAEKTYRIVVLRKNLVEECGQQFVCDSVRYFFYVTNDRTTN